MTDEELVERLRVLDPWLNELEVIDEAADRIEALRDARDTMGNLWAKEAAEKQVALERIEALTEQLEAARADAKKAEAYAEELEEKLRARTAERNHANDVTDAAIEEVNRLKALLAENEARLGKAVDFLTEADRRIIWEGLGFGNDFADSVDAFLAKHGEQP
jgi:septation ring formation regulator EzrA